MQGSSAVVDLAAWQDGCPAVPHIFSGSRLQSPEAGASQDTDWRPSFVPVEPPGGIADPSPLGRQILGNPSPQCY